MKKLIIVSGFMSLFAGTTKAQNVTEVLQPAYHVVEFGFRFMPTFSAFDMTTSSGGTIKGEVTLGYGVGALLAVNLSNHIGIQGEVIYNSLSQKYKDQNLNREIKVQYINIPLLFALNTGKSNPVNLNLVIGPQIGMNIGSSITSSGSGNSDTLVTVLATKKSDFGFAYGAGLQFALNKTRTIHLATGFRGVYGFVNISNTGQATSGNSYYILDRASVRTMSAYVGITFSF